MTTLFLLRHGETDWNRDRRIQGTTDVPLNDTGRVQARSAACTLREHSPVDTPMSVITSDLSRARETARIVTDELGLPAAQTCSALRERGYGEAEGMPLAEFNRRWGGPHAFEITGAEDRAEVRARALTGLGVAVRQLRRSTAPSPAALVAVSHGGLIREVLSHASGGELPRPGERVPNGSIVELRWESDRVSVISYPGKRLD